ncbi:MAG: signal peptidase I [Planctomycetota bacterium]|nr:MAG: signal peptidase I [Planctomycetota bacterium]
MASTGILIAVLGATLVLQLFVSVWLLQAGLRLAKVAKAKFKAGVATIVTIWLVDFVVWALTFVLMLLVYLVFNLRILRWRHKTSRKQAFVAWLVLQFIAFPNWLLAEGVVKPFLVEAFSIPTNAMAPTICGEHLQEKCPKCGGTLIISSNSVKLDRDLGICKDCLRTTEVPIQDRTLHGGDRVLVSKLLKPRRWDLIVFRYPDDPSVPYVKRLVGLPGETLSIHDGGVWMQDKELQKPTNLAGLTYVANPDRAHDDMWGPVALAADESLVLGDFSARSKDSRLWEIGAPGHPPYAVPDSHLIGVVTHIYWPPSRWRVFR